MQMKIKLSGHSKNFPLNIILTRIRKTPKKPRSNDITRHYAKIVNAYEVLKDPETRKAYNRGGEKAVEDHF